MFTGEYILSLDGKGRISIPGAFRGVLERQAGASLILTRDSDVWLSAYPVEEWRKLGEKVKGLMTLEPRQVHDCLRYLYSNAVECVIDGQGRILIPPHLREYARLTKEVAMIGFDKKFEMWDADHWRRKKEVLAQHEQGIRDVLTGLGY